MMSETLRNGLARYRIGERVRALRLKKKMGLVELGKHTGLSPALLSKIERQRLFPTLPTLLRIALVFSVDLTYFLAGAREKPLIAVTRGHERLRLPEKPGRGAISYQFESLDFPVTERRFSTYYAEFLEGGGDELRRHEHAGVEFIYVLSGTLHVHIGGKPGPSRGGTSDPKEDHAQTLNTGDALYFDSSLPHGYRRAGRRRCTAIVVTAG
jgi:transcriptional regulator with XRE-family HTH domain